MSEPNDDWTQGDLDLGTDHWLRWTDWSPDVALNPQYSGLPEMPAGQHFGAIVFHRRPDGTVCCGGITFVTALFEAARERGVEFGRDSAAWDVGSWEPLTLTPSLLCRAPVYDADSKVVGECGDHGFVTAGKWHAA